MKILVASDSFKETLSSEEVGQTIKQALPMYDVDVVSISDGGEGIIEALETKLTGQKILLDIREPLGRWIKGYYYLAGDTAVIESAVGCGLSLLTETEKNPLLTSSYGVGMLIKDAIVKGANHIIVGIGGTSTNDCGMGMLEAMGVKFYSGKELFNLKGSDLEKIRSFDTKKFDELIQETTFEIACDVDNPLLGYNGATYTFAPQKGATPGICEVLEKGMTHFSNLVEETLNVAYKELPGTGAAGGMGMCFMSFFNGTLKPGIELVLDTIGFDQLISDYDLVITGEGKIDAQTSHGKVLKGILNRTKQQHIKTLAVCGYNEGERMDFDQVFAVVPTVATLKESMMSPKENLLRLIEIKIKPYIDTL